MSKFAFRLPRFFQSAHLTIKSKLMIVLILLCTASILTFGIKSYLDFRTTISKRLLSKLTTNRNTKLNYIKFYFENIRNQVSVLSQDRAFVDAMREFRRTFRALQTTTTQTFAQDSADVRAYYEKEFLPRIAGGDTSKTANFVVDAFMPQTPAAMYLQNQYIAANPNPVGEKKRLERAPDSSAYSAVHAMYHPMFRQFVEKFNYYDMFLIDAETSEVIYTVFKETDFTTNLKTGPNKGSSLAKLFENAAESKERGYVKIIDFLPYEPSYGAPAAFIGTPIFDGGKLIGVLAFQLSVDEITKITTSNKDWKGDGLGTTGETYLVGPDYTMRSQSRFLLEDAKKYVATLRETNLPSNTIEKIQTLNTSILLQEVRSEATTEAQAGRSDAKLIRDYRNIPVLSAYAPLQIPDLQWVLLSEMDVSEAFEPVYEYERSLLIWTAISILVATLVALLVANTLTQPIADLTYNAQSISEGRMTDLRRVRSGDEFERLSTSFESMVQSLQAQRELVELRNKDFERLLYSVFPDPVARRLEHNERYFVESVPGVSIIVSEVIGFTNLMHSIGNEHSVEILNDIMIAFDEAAARHGIEKIKTMGDTYIAVAGLFNPQIDHAIHAVDFASDIRGIVQRIGAERGVVIDLSAGIHAGEVTTYLIGKRKFNFDIIGETFFIARAICDAAFQQRGTLMVSQSVFDLTQGLYDFESEVALNYAGRMTLNVWSVKTAKPAAVREM
jgi:class 3 adenylate cyclase